MIFQLPKNKCEKPHNHNKRRKKAARKGRKLGAVKAGCSAAISLGKHEQKCPLCSVMAASDVQLIAHFAEQHYEVKESEVTRNDGSIPRNRQRQRKCILVRYDKYTHCKVISTVRYNNCQSPCSIQECRIVSSFIHLNKCLTTICI